MKKIQAKKKRDKAEVEARKDALEIAAPEDGQVKSILDKEDDIPILFNWSISLF